ncbi:MAG: hypothetical protein ACODAE_09360 [Gemmatimonadota bacterium]
MMTRAFAPSESCSVAAAAADGGGDVADRCTSDLESAGRSPIACRFSGDEAAARLGEMRGLAEAVEEVRELDDGFALRYPGGDGMPGRLRMLAGFIERERECCPFFRFELELEPERGPIWLRLRGRPGVKEYLERELADALGRPRG